jgi:hypothetical protein
MAARVCALLPLSPRYPPFTAHLNAAWTRCDEVTAHLEQFVADFWFKEAVDIVKEWEALTAFFKLSWWQRIWTVQEMVAEYDLVIVRSPGMR